MEGGHFQARVMQMSSKEASIHELSAIYEDAAAIHGQATRDGNSRTANAQYKRIIVVWNELRRRGDDGRAALSRLMGSSNPHVRGWAASHVLEFEPEAAEPELTRLAQGPPSPVRLDAEMTLKEWRAGRLKFTGE